MAALTLTVGISILQHKSIEEPQETALLGIPISITGQLLFLHVITAVSTLSMMHGEQYNGNG